jgi:copper chaperone
MWNKQFAALAERFLVLRFDARGHGRSSLPGTPSSFADDLVALLDVVGIDEAALVGLSFGARPTGSASIEVNGSRRGMSCDHCAASVTEEVQQVEGGTAVVVDVEAGRVAVQGQRFSHEAIPAAVDEAGYEVVAA